MTDVFIKIFNMSVAAAWIVPIVIVLRLFLKKAPKWTVCLLWGIVGIRLSFPFSFKSIMSLLPSARTIPPDILTSPRPQIHSGIPSLNSTVNPILEETARESALRGESFMEGLMTAAVVAWICGLLLILLYGVFSYLRLKKRVAPSLKLDDRIYLCDNIDTPFILGVVRPNIYLPSTLSDTEAKYVIAHERAHLKRLDHIIKPIGFVLLAIHWFNPFIWAAYILLCRDIEKACDERAIKDLDKESKKGYLEALLSCSIKSRIISACPLAFGEVGVKSRVRSVLSYKRPALWIIIAAVIASVILSVCFLTDPKEDKKPQTVSNPVITFLGQGTDRDGVSLIISDYDLTGKDPFIEVEWFNDTDEVYSYGMAYDILFEEDGKYRSCKKQDLFFHLLGIILNPNSVNTERYELSAFDMTRAGKYRFVSDFTEEIYIDFEISDGPTPIPGETVGPISPVFEESYIYTDAPGIDKPQFTLGVNGRFSLSQSSYSSYLAIGDYALEGDRLTLYADNNTVYCFRAENEGYVFVAEGSDPITSYGYSISATARSPVPDGAFFKKTITESNYSPVFDSITADIDGDGKDEICTLSYGPTSGIFSFVFTAVNDEVAYKNTFASSYHTVSFATDEKGKVYINAERDFDGKTTRFDIDISDGNILLSCEDEEAFFWSK